MFQGVPTRNASGLQLAVPDRGLALEWIWKFEIVTPKTRTWYHVFSNLGPNRWIQQASFDHFLKMFLSHCFTLILFSENVAASLTVFLYNPHLAGLWPAVPEVLLPLAEPKLNGGLMCCNRRVPTQKNLLNGCQKQIYLAKSANLVQSHCQENSLQHLQQQPSGSFLQPVAGGSHWSSERGKASWTDMSCKNAY